MNEFIKPELLILVPVLVAAGTLIKSSSIDNRLIPLILGIAGIVLSGIWIFSAGLPADAGGVLAALFSSVTQGILIASAAVYGNQMVKQLTDKAQDGKGMGDTSGKDGRG